MANDVFGQENRRGTHVFSDIPGPEQRRGWRRPVWSPARSSSAGTGSASCPVEWRPDSLRSCSSWPPGWPPDALESREVLEEYVNKREDRRAERRI